MVLICIYNETEFNLTIEKYILKKIYYECHSIDYNLHKIIGLNVYKIFFTSPYFILIDSRTWR